MASRVGLGKACILERDTAINQDIRALLPKKPGQVDQKFCLYWLQSVADVIVAAGSGATVQGIKLPFIKSLPFPVISLDEQERVVAILDQAFAAVDRARTNAEANLADALSLRSRKIETELSDDGLGSLEPLGGYVDLLTGFAFKSAGYSDDPENIRLVRGDNIVQGSFRWAGVKRWPMKDREAYARYELALNDILIAMDRTWVSAGIKYAIVDEEALPSLLVQRVARLRARESVLPSYIGYWIGSSLFEKYVLSIQTGLGVPHVSGKQLENFKVRIPPLAKQRALVQKLDAISEKCTQAAAAYEAQLDDISTLRQSLLQRTFSGQLG